MNDLDSLCQAPIATVSALIGSRSVSPVELTAAMLARIERIDPDLGSYVTVTAEHAMRQAQAAESEIVRGARRGPLHGISIGLKDCIDTHAIPTACGSRILEGRRPLRDAHVAARLRDVGTVLLGKHAMTEFAFSAYHPTFRAPRNPWDSGRWSGLSSSGSAVSVAAGLAFGSIGTDTGGSIRWPSAANGVVGIKPSFGRIGRTGVAPLAASLDHVGPIARSVEDAAMLLEAIAGHDPHDPFSLPAAMDRYREAASHGIDGLRVGYDPAYCSRHADGVACAAAERAWAVLERAGAVAVPVDCSFMLEICYHFIAVAGAEALTAYREYHPARLPELGPIFADLLDSAVHARPEDLARAIEARKRLEGMLRELFRSVDLLILPSLRSAAFPLADLETLLQAPADEVASFMALTVPFNFSGHPAITLPSGLSPEGLPLGLQIVGRHMAEVSMIAAAAAFEREAPWPGLGSYDRHTEDRPKGKDI